MGMNKRKLFGDFFGARKRCEKLFYGENSFEKARMTGGHEDEEEVAGR